MAQTNYIQQAQQQSEWERMQKIIEARERAQAQQAMINQWAKEGNNGALLGNILSSALMRYLGNRNDTKNDNGTPTPTETPTLSANPADLASQAMGGYRPPQSYDFANAPTTVEQMLNLPEDAMRRYWKQQGYFNGF